MFSSGLDESQPSGALKSRLPSDFGRRTPHFAMTMAGVGYRVKSVTAIWNRFDSTAKASWFQFGGMLSLVGQSRLKS